jgi:monoamine oxidase
MGENVKLIVALREAVWEKQNLTSELQSDGLVGMTWAATNPLSRGPVALTLFSGGHQAGDLRRLEPTLRNDQAFRSIAPAYPDLPAALIKTRFVDWPGMPMTQASYSFPAPGQVTAFGPLLVDGLAGDGRAPLMFAGEHTAYAFIGYMEGALSSGVRAAKTVLGEGTPLGTGRMPATTTTTAPASEIAPDPLAPDAPQSEPETPEPVPAPAEKEGAPA